MKTPTKKTRKKRLRAPPALNAVSYTIPDGQALGLLPGKTKVYELGKAGILDLYTDGAGRTMVTGKSARALQGIKDDATA